MLVGQVPEDAGTVPYDELLALLSGPTHAFGQLREARRSCSEAFKDYVGLTPLTPNTTEHLNLEKGFFLPLRDNWMNGARWFRCDAGMLPLEGGPRSTTEPLRSVAAREPQAPWRECDKKALKTEGYQPSEGDQGEVTSCDKPHVAELVARVELVDPKLDPIAADKDALLNYIKTELAPLCLDLAARIVGESDFKRRLDQDLFVSVSANQVDFWPTDPASREAFCVIFTKKETVGILRGLGSKPLQRA